MNENLYATPNNYQDEINEILASCDYGTRVKKFRVLARREIKKLEKLGKVWNWVEVHNFTSSFVFNCHVIDRTKVCDLSRHYVIEGSKNEVSL